MVSENTPASEQGASESWRIHPSQCPRGRGLRHVLRNRREWSNGTTVEEIVGDYPNFESAWNGEKTRDATRAIRCSVCYDNHPLVRDAKDATRGSATSAPASAYRRPEQR